MIFRDISLKPYNTFGLDYKADCLVILESEEEAVSFFRERGSCNDPLLILGGGSNILFTRNFGGTIVYARIEGIKIDEKNSENALVSAGAGVNWDSFVEWCVGNGLGGVENLSLIPGTVGATPVQNIGAYGVEIKDTIERVRTFELATGTIRDFSNEECRFGYRDSVFKGSYKGKYMVIKVFYRLTYNSLFKTDYGSLNEEIMKKGGKSLQNIREAVISIRKKKLPDPLEIGNAGSFFKNPLVDNALAEKLKTSHPGMPSFADPSGRTKLAAGWLIEQCGWKGKRNGDAGVHDRQALVIVNYGKATGNDLLDLSEKVRKSVFEKFGIVLDREVEVI